MKLWLISQGINNGYDTYDSAVVAAETELEARQTYPSVGDFEYYYKDGSWFWTWDAHPELGAKKESGGCWANNAEQVDLEYLGEAKPGTEAGVICASFNAG